MPATRKTKIGEKKKISPKGEQHKQKMPIVQTQPVETKPQTGAKVHPFAAFIHSNHSGKAFSQSQKILSTAAEKKGCVNSK